MKRRKYDKEFKLMAVELSKSRKDIPVLAKELDLRPELIYRWRKEYLDNKEGSFPGNGNVKQTEQEAEIARLKKELMNAQMERDILKKAVSIFSKSDGKYSNS
jgi:transposase